MFNLIVAGDCETWKSKMFALDMDRCIKKGEYSSEEIATRFGNFTEDAIAQLKSFPCLFAYEDPCGKAPRFGWLKNIKKRTNQITIECEYVEVAPWITADDLRSAQSNLDIYGWELNRTHWAVKDVDLSEELLAFGVSLPLTWSGKQTTVNPENHVFDVAFSFPGEARAFVEQVLRELDKRMNPDQVFYDNHFKAYLARPNLDVYLSRIYRENANLIVVFLSGDYQRKPWPGLEFRTVREIIFEKKHDKVMYIRLDDAQIDGILKTDGYIDARQHTAAEIAGFIYQRVKLETNATGR